MHYHSFNTIFGSCSITNDGKTQADISFADSTDYTSDNEQREVVRENPHGIRQCNSNLPINNATTTNSTK